MDSAEHKHLILGTAGHIDHGKSSLIQALTGVDPDRLDEEKRRGITIELGFAELDLGEGLTMGVVDVPGHERFVRQMIAGATGIDVALFCIAADDGIMPQTIEHKAILELLGLSHCVVALTKSDLVDSEWIDLISQEIREFLSDSSFAQAPIIPVSSRTGNGLEHLKAALRTAAEQSTRTKRGSIVRLPIDRVFTIRGSGTVITGTLWNGTIAPDDELEILPSHIVTRVKSVQIHSENVERADAGNRVALNLNAVKTTDVSAGDFLVTPGTLEPSDRFDAFFTYLDTTKSGKPLKSGSRVHIAHGTREVIGRILFMNGKELLRAGESAYVQFRMEEPLPLSWRDRFIVRSYSPVHVIGGGKVLLAHPRHRTNLSDDESKLLDALNREDEAEAVRVTFAMQAYPIAAEHIGEFIDMPVKAVVSRLDALRDGGGALVIGDGKTPSYTTKAVRQKHLTRIENALMRFHTENPQHTGITKAALKQLCDYRGDDYGFDVLLAEAQGEGKIVVDEGEISHPKAGGGAKKAEEQAVAAVFELLRAGETQPPLLPELIKQTGLDTSLVHRALGSLEKQERIRRVNSELSFTVEAIATLESALRSYLEAQGQATAADLKDAMQSSRKYAIPLLEYFDNQGITVRDGDTRRLRR